MAVSSTWFHGDGGEGESSKCQDGLLMLSGSYYKLLVYVCVYSSVCSKEIKQIRSHDRPRKWENNIVYISHSRLISLWKMVSQTWKTKKHESPYERFMARYLRVLEIIRFDCASYFRTLFFLVHISLSFFVFASCLMHNDVKCMKLVAKNERSDSIKRRLGKSNK